MPRQPTREPMALADVTEIVGGPAGLAAAVLAHARRTTVVIDRPAPSAVPGVPAASDAADPLPRSWLRDTRIRAVQDGAVVLDDEATGLSPLSAPPFPSDGGLTVSTTAGRVLCARHMLVATGVWGHDPEHGFGRLLGRSSYPGPVVVVGAFAQAAADAWALARWNDDIVLVTGDEVPTRDSLRLEAAGGRTSQRAGRREPQAYRRRPPARRGVGHGTTVACGAACCAWQAARPPARTRCASTVTAAPARPTPSPRTGP